MFLLTDYSSDYETLLKQTNKCTIEVKRMRSLALEIFKAFNESCPYQYQHEFFFKKILRYLPLRVWNSLPKQWKIETSYVKFKEETDKWFGPYAPI